MKKIIGISILVVAFLLTAAETWTGYQEITSTYTVDPGAILVIEPGTTVRFEHNSKLVVQGQLIAIGNKSEPIRFTSLEPSVSGYDYWEGIEFYESGDSKDSSFMKYCIVDNIDKVQQKASQEGSVSAVRSVLSVSYCTIQYNKSFRGGGFYFNSCGVHLYENKILNNKAMYEGGGIYINNADGAEWFETVIEKNLIKDNLVYNPESTQYGGGGIAVFDPVRYANYIQISENDIISNMVARETEPGSGVYVPAGAGGGINIYQSESIDMQIIGNKIMYNQALNAGGGWIKCTDDPVNLRKLFFKNNIVTNNSGYNFGGFYFYTGNIKNEEAIEFWNNNFVHNLNTGGKTGAGGLSIEHNDNYFQMKNSILWENLKSGETSDIAISPYVGFDRFISFCNSTSLIEGQGNMSANSIFNRPVDGIGATPYVDYLRGDFHLSLLSPCLDKGDPETGSEWDGTSPNIGAWGLTYEATTSKFDPMVFTKPISLTVERGQVILMDCSRYPDQVQFNDIIIEDGGQLFIQPNDQEIIKIGYLDVRGKKIGNEYTTRFEKLVDDKVYRYSKYILDVNQMNCAGVDFSDMCVTISGTERSTLYDSRIYIKENDPNPEITNEIGIISSSFDFDISNNVISNFDTGISSPPIKGKASKIGRITNNTITFDADASKAGQAKKGISVDEAEVDIEDNEIVNPDEGIEAAKSSGRITNNTVTFDADASKQSNGKKGIFIYDGSNMEVTGNLITSTDIVSPIISGIEIENSSIIASYNVIDFTEYNSKLNYYGFYTEGLGPNSKFINNTINNSTYGFYNLGSADPTDFINNIVWGDINGNVASEPNILLAYNNDVLGGIYGVISSKDNFKEDPWYKSVKISDFYLDGKSKCIDAGMYIEGFHELSVNYYGDAPDVGAIEYYVAVIIDLNSPSNVNISTAGTVATITWNSVDNANSYKIYRTTDPYDNDSFQLVNSTASLYWSTSISIATKYFYYVIASTDAATKSVDDTVIPDKDTMKIKIPAKKIFRNEDELSTR
ncbi:MAG: right-handed parallel beta-helix repeat-containing protein [Candidatus Delongbacteria bacterium]|nr:right-handed parallel beta-helix repeat-containing protein [Candidatus Delongbacteria bacterium]